MKVISTLSFLLFTGFSLSATAQDETCYSETFSNGTNGWTYSQGASIHSYNNPAQNCSPDRGIVTPGVGGNNPCQVKTPVLTSTGGQKVKMMFDMFVMDANLRCNSWKDFACATSVDVMYYANGNAYRGATDYNLPPNGPGNSGRVTINFYVGPNLPAGTPYQVEIFFKFKSGVGECVQQNTKYIFDNFNICNLSDVSEKGAGLHNTLKQSPQLNHTTTTATSLYPNPTAGVAQVTIPNYSSLKQIFVTDVSGRSVKQFSAVPAIPVNGLQKGTYFIRMIRLNGAINTVKLLVN
ncbi:MAG: T9SS type A sorting domain-containing protein [Bacteroidetes bacterium]|nr:T9SS type A sorting domain-containing protein [Bacteroidota bacterium]